MNPVEGVTCGTYQYYRWPDLCKIVVQPVNLRFTSNNKGTKDKKRSKVLKYQRWTSELDKEITLHTRSRKTCHHAYIPIGTGVPWQQDQLNAVGNTSTQRIWGKICYLFECRKWNPCRETTSTELSQLILLNRVQKPNCCDLSNNSLETVVEIQKLETTCKYS